MFIKRLKLGKAFFLALAFLLAFAVFRLCGISCLWLHFFKLPCPGCGFTRAVISALKLDFAKAFYYHPLFFTLPFLVLLVLTDGKPFKNEKLNRILLFSLIIAFLLVWAFRLAFGGFVYLQP